MSYQAIARKWRPTTFEEIAGQTHVTRTLQNAIRLGRIHHAFLFTGARGVGKTTAARALARALNCEQGPTPTPCGECISCREILSGVSPDVIEIDGASNNSVDDVRDLRESVRYMPAHGRYKVYIVDEVHMLSKGAFNALLKTLEEPPAHVVFLFATTEPQKIPDTILSRVQRFDFKRIPQQIVVDRLRAICDAEAVDIPDDGLRLIARAGEGSMRDAQSLLDQVIAFVGEAATLDQVSEVLGLVDRALLYQMLEGMLLGEADRCLEAIDRVYGYGYDLSEFTSELLELLRNATLVRLSPSSRRYLDVPDDERTRLEALASDVPSDIFVRSFQVMLDVHEQVARSTRPRLVLEMAVARLVSIRPARPLDQIVDRMEDLERRLRHGGAAPRARSPRPQRPAASGDDDADPEAAPPEAARRAAPPAPARPAPTPSAGPPKTAAPAPIDAATPPPEKPASPEPLPDTATPQERWEALRSWLRDGGVSYEVLSDDSVFLGVEGGAVVLGFPSPFKQRNAEQIADDPRVIAGLRMLFPGAVRLANRLRDAGVDTMTRREAHTVAREAALSALRQEMAAHPAVRRVLEAVDGELEAVRPDGPLHIDVDSVLEAPTATWEASP